MMIILETIMSIRDFYKDVKSDYLSIPPKKIIKLVTDHQIVRKESLVGVFLGRCSLGTLLLISSFLD